MLRPRREFPDPVKRAVLDRSGGICECKLVPQLPTYGVGCGVHLGPGNTFIEHIIPDAIDGPNTASNAAALCKTCWRLKTDLYDLPIIADTTRMQDRHYGIGGDGRGRNPLPGGRRDSRKRTMSGEVVDRRTGERWGR
jgi:hypothetical protein